MKTSLSERVSGPVGFHPFQEGSGCPGVAFVGNGDIRVTGTATASTGASSPKSRSSVSLLSTTRSTRRGPSAPGGWARCRSSRLDPAGYDGLSC